MKTLPFILLLLGVILAVVSIMSAPNEVDYELHTNAQALQNCLYLLVLAVLSLGCAIILSLTGKKTVI